MRDACRNDYDIPSRDCLLDTVRIVLMAETKTRLAIGDTQDFV